MSDDRLSEIARQAGYDFLLSRKEKHAIVQGVVDTYAKGFLDAIERIQAEDATGALEPILKKLLGVNRPV